MHFTPRPKNDFMEYIERYYEECRKRCPNIAAIAGKWTFEDLIPGLSDFDTRFIVEDGMTADDWRNMSAAVGEVHLDICTKFPHWARNMEHLPGINLTWGELTDPAAYYPEYPQWTFYDTTDRERLATAEKYLADKPWGAQDEYFHLKKFCLYYGRYDRAIDPAVNLGPYENKYPLHSRLMHYFCPPVQSALCILEKRPVRGKMEAMRLLSGRFGELKVFDEILDAVDRHYEAPELYVEPEVSYLEDRLESALNVVREAIAPELTLIEDAPKKSIIEWKAELRNVPIDPALRVFDAAKFSRLMEGRLEFYAHAPAHFDSIWCIENELRRLKQSSFTIPFGVFWKELTGETMENPVDILDKLCPNLLTEEEVRCTRTFDRLLPGHWEDGTQKQIARDLAAIFDGFFHALCKVADRVKEISREKRTCK